MKLKKLILHIGVHKTGTTAIQTFLYKNNDLLNRQGFYLPDYLFCSEHKPAKLRYSIIKKDASLSRAMLKKIVKKAEKKSCHTVIVSDEDYCKANEHDLSNVKIFGEFFEEVEVLIYCRRPDRQSESGFAFCVMWKTSKYSKSPEQWYADNPGKNYFFIADFYKRTIPGCSIKLVSYDFQKDRLIDSFIAACNMKDVPYAVPEKNESNISANKFMIEVMNEVNKYILKDKLFKEIKDYVLNHKKLQNGPKAIFFNHDQRIENQKIVEKANQKFIEVFNNGEELFKPLTPIDVPPGLDPDLKIEILNEIIKRYNLDNKQEPESIVRFTEKLKIRKSMHNADIFREIALLCEYLSLYQAAFTLIKLAHINRPEGPTISRKLKEINSKADSDKKKSNELFNIIGLIDNAYGYDYVTEEITGPLRKNLKIPNKIKSFEIVREIALFCEWYDEISAAYLFMMLAKREKFQGPMINRKCLRYRNILSSNQKENCPKVFLHMGANKTASTSIQCTLSSNRDFLKSYGEGYLFNRSWRINSSKTFKYLCGENFEATRTYLNEGKVDSNLHGNYDTRYLDDILNEIKHFEGVNHIFSGEDLHFLNYRKMYEVKEILMQLIPECEIHVIYTVRNYVSYINSFVQQSAKGGRGEQVLLCKRKRDGNYFQSSIRKMVSIFGSENVTIYPFEESVKHEMGPVGYFFEKLGFDREAIQKIDLKRRNESLSNTAGKLIFWINKKLSWYLGPMGYFFEKLGFDREAIHNIDLKRKNDLLSNTAAKLIVWINKKFSRINDPRFFDFNKIRKFLRPLHKVSGNAKYTVPGKKIKKLYPSIKKEALWLKKFCNIDYTDIEIKNDVKIVFDEAFEQDIKDLFNELNHVIRHIAYLCFLEKSKSWFIDSTSKKTFASLARWCEVNHPETSRKDYLSRL